MLNFNRALVAASAAILLAGLSAESHAQASDVDCNKCVDSSDLAGGAVTTAKIAPKAVTTSKIANQAVTASKIDKNAVTTAKIKNGAVTLAKVVPKLKNTINESCAPGMVATGIDNQGRFVCTPLGAGPDGPDYFPYGPQVDVNPSRLNEWTECYRDLYNNDQVLVADIFAGCSGSKLIFACKEVAETTIKLLAAGNRDAMLADTGNTNVTTPDNGSEWYYANSYSIGFAGEGDPVTRGSCDTSNVGDADQRLCWHTFDNELDGGWRCGTATNLNSSADWERIIYHVE